MARTSTASSTEVLAGLVDRVTFHNSENGFCVLRVKARGQRDLITVIGHAAMISAGEFVQASGSWINDRTHGVQFRASFLKATAPTRSCRTARLTSSRRRSLDPSVGPQQLEACRALELADRQLTGAAELGLTGLASKPSLEHGAHIILH